jgi:ABC-type transporter Mla subunit MlaD
MPATVAGEGTATLERPLAALEGRLSALGLALQQNDPEVVDRAAHELQTALAQAVDQFRAAARRGGIPPALRQRLARAGAEVAAQREALARASASLDRAIDVLMPRTAPMGLYSAVGGNDRALGVGGVRA